MVLIPLASNYSFVIRVPKMYNYLVQKSLEGPMTSVPWPRYLEEVLMDPVAVYQSWWVAWVGESWWVALVWSHPAQAGSYAIFES